MFSFDHSIRLLVFISTALEKQALFGNSGEHWFRTHHQVMICNPGFSGGVGVGRGLPSLGDNLQSDFSIISLRGGGVGVHCTCDKSVKV